jgi:hypothetical protein
MPREAVESRGKLSLVRIQKKEAEPLLFRKKAKETRFGYDQFALEYAVSQGGDKTQPHRLQTVFLQHKLASERLVQYILQSSRINNRRNKRLSLEGIKQQPGIAFVR